MAGPPKSLQGGVAAGNFRFPMDDGASSPYATFLAELEQIQRHKWLVSEREGRDVGFERALNEWARNHRTEWRREQNRRRAWSARRGR